jgi:hypothetical protein
MGEDAELHYQCVGLRTTMSKWSFSSIRDEKRSILCSAVRMIDATPTLRYIGMDDKQHDNVTVSPSI